MTTRLRHLAEINPATPAFERVSIDTEVTFMPLETVWPRGRADFTRTQLKAKVASGYVRFQDGDVLLPKVTPTFQAMRSTVARNLVGGLGAGSTELHVLRARPGNDSRFICYATQLKAFIDAGEAAFQGVAGLQRVPADFVANFVVPQVSHEGQLRIADFLDEQIEMLDAIVDRRRLQKDLVRQSEAALLSEELESREGAGRVRVKFLTSLLTSGPRGWGEYLAEEGSPFVRIANLSRRGITLRTDNLLRMLAPAGAETKRSQTQVGDVLVSITADLGSVAVVPEAAAHGNVSQHIALLRPVPGRCDGQYLAWAIRAPQANRELTSSGYGGTKTGLGLTDVGNLEVSVCSQEEQRRRVMRIERRVRINNEALLSLSRLDDLLEERKQTLITAAVTGQFDVTTARKVSIT